MTTVTNDIFATVPDQDYLSLFENDQPRYNRIVKFLDFKKEDVSKATDVKVTNIRYDDRIPREVRDRIKEWAILLNLVAEHFEGNAEKTTLWFTTPNPLFGNLSPRDMIRLGRYKKLLKFVVNAIAENKR